MLIWSVYTHPHSNTWTYTIKVQKSPQRLFGMWTNKRFRGRSILSLTLFRIASMGIINADWLTVDFIIGFKFSADTTAPRHEHQPRALFTRALWHLCHWGHWACKSLVPGLRTPRGTWGLRGSAEGRARDTRAFSTHARGLVWRPRDPTNSQHHWGTKMPSQIAFSEEELRAQCCVETLMPGSQ